jgi:hypothetical protein
VKGQWKSDLLVTTQITKKDKVMAGKKEKPLQEWVEEITTANNNNFKMIEVLAQRGSSLNERLELVEMLVADIRISLNKVLDHLNITIEEEGE